MTKRPTPLGNENHPRNKVALLPITVHTPQCHGGGVLALLVCCKDRAQLRPPAHRPADSMPSRRRIDGVYPLTEGDALVRPRAHALLKKLQRPETVRLERATAPALELCWTNAMPPLARIDRSGSQKTKQDELSLLSGQRATMARDREKTSEQSGGRRCGRLPGSTKAFCCGLPGAM